MFIVGRDGISYQIIKQSKTELTVQDSNGTLKVINPDDVQRQVSKWYEIIKLLIQFWAVLKNAF